MRKCSVRWFECVYLEAVGHSLSKPDVLLLLDVLADVPVLHGNLALSWGYAGLSSVHVAVDLDGILSAALVRVNPVLAWRTRLSEKKSQNKSALKLSLMLPSTIIHFL